MLYCNIFYSQYLQVDNLCLVDPIRLYSEHFVTVLLLNKLHRDKNLKNTEKSKENLKYHNPIIRVTIE